MEFLSPMMFQQAQEQSGLANQFAQQNLAIGGQDLQSKLLGNMFQQQADPMRLQAMGLENQGRQNANSISGVNARIAGGTEQEAMAAKRAELLAKASDDELKALRTQAEKEYESDDPAVRARGEKKLMASVAEFNRRNKTADAVKVAEVGSDARLNIARMQQDGMNSRNTENINSRAQLAAAKNAAAAAKANGSAPNAEKAAVRAQMLADEADTPEEREYYLNQAKGFTAYSMALKNAGAGTKPDMAQFGIQTNAVNTGMGSINPRPAGMAPMAPNMNPSTGGRGDPPAGAAIVTPSDAAHRRSVTGLSALEEQYVNETNPAKKQQLAAAIDATRNALGQNTQAAGQPPKAPAAPAKPKLSEVQNMYPGVPADKLREAYKKKFGVDLQ